MALRYLLPGQMHFMSTHGFSVLMISADSKDLTAVIEREQCRHVIVPMTRKITPWHDLKCLFNLIKIFRKEKPDIVHTHTPKAGLLGMLAAKLCGVKVRIHTVAGLPLMVEKGFKYQLLKFIEKLTYASAGQVWPNSNSLMQFIIKNKLCKPSKLSIIAKGSTNGVQLERFSKENLDAKVTDEIKAQINYSDDNIYLLCIGRLVVDKGIAELVHVFTQLQKTNDELVLILVGEYESTLDPLPAETLHEIEINGRAKNHQNGDAGHDDRVVPGKTQELLKPGFHGGGATFSLQAISKVRISALSARSREISAMVANSGPIAGSLRRSST